MKYHDSTAVLYSISGQNDFLLKLYVYHLYLDITAAPKYTMPTFACSVSALAR
jgi:hypothetical protein